MPRTRALALLLVAALFLPACGNDSGGTTDANSGGGESAGSGTPTFRFSAIPDEKKSDYAARFAPVAKYLEAKLGVPVEFVHAAKYSDSVEHFRAGRIHGAWFGGLSGVQARDAVAGAKAVVQGDKDPTFYSYFIAHKDSGLQPSEEFPQEIASKRFTFGSKGSTSGRLMPEHFIRTFSGKSPKEFFGAENSYSGSHTNTLKLVANGDFMVGALNYTVYDDAVAKGEVDPKVCYVLWKTPTYADYNLTIRPKLDEEFGEGFEQKLVKAFLEMDDAESLKAFRRDKFIPAKNEDFAGIEKLARQLGFIR